MSFVALVGGAKLPTGGIFWPSLIACEGGGVCAKFVMARTSSALALFALFKAAESGRNCLKSSRRSVAVLNRLVTWA